MRINKQNDTRDCGIYVLQYFMHKILKKQVDINYLKLKASYGPQGISLATLDTMAQEFGLKLETYETNFKDLLNINKVDMPFIALINDEGLFHYVVVEKIDTKFVTFQDSRTGARAKLILERFEQVFANYISFVYKDDFNTEKPPITAIDTTYKNLFSFDSKTLMMLMLGIMYSTLTFASSFFAKLVFDYVLPSHLHKTLFILFIAFIWINIVRFGSLMMKNLLTKKLTNKIEFKLKDTIFQKLSNSGLDFTSKLTSNEILKRLSYVNFIANYRANFIYTLLTEFVSVILSGVLLIWVSLPLFGVVVVACIITSIINIIFHFYIHRKYGNYIASSHDQFVSEMDAVNSVNSFKNQSAQNFVELQRIKKHYLFKEKEYSLDIKKNFNTLVNDMLIGNLSLILIFVASILIFNNKITSGTLVMILIVTPYFIQPLISLTSLIMMRKIIEKHTQMINFILNFEEIKMSNKGVEINDINQIIIKNLKFGYEPKKDILDINELKIDKNIQICGDNGSGKSTLLNILNFKYSTISGEVSFNGHEVKFINTKSLQNNTILLNNSIFLSSMSVYDFLTCGNPTLHKNLMENMSVYGLDQLMKRLKITFDLKIINNGTNISSGQRQFIILLKLFTQKFKLILLDEAFENVDNEVFKHLQKSIIDYQHQARFIEISHAKKYLYQNQEVVLEEINRAN